MITIFKKDLIKNLIEKNYLTQKELKIIEKESKKTKKSFEELILEKGIISKEDLLKIKVNIAKIPIANLDQFIDNSLINLIPENIIINNFVLPISKDEKNLIIAINDPWDEDLIQFIKKKTNLNIKTQYAPAQKIIETFKKIKEWNENIEKEKLSNIKEVDIGESVIKTVDSIIKNAIKMNASDIHIEPQENFIILRYRIDGILKDVATFPKEITPALIARIKVLSNLKLDEHRLPQDGRFKMEIHNKKYSFRVSIMPIFDGEKAAIRILEEEGKNFNLKELGFLDINIEKINNAIHKPYGMILATGPTGSGKTTTLYTILKMLNKPEVNIVTIEDPIEYRLERANQTQVKPEIGLTFANGLRSILRQDPNIIMVGEIRDNETANLAINAALTGHLVLSTLHTNNASGAIPRLLDMKVEGFLIASTVNIIIAQRLVRKLYDKTKIPYKLSTEEVHELSKSINIEKIEKRLIQFNLLKQGEKLEDVIFYRPNPSEEAPDGYIERVGIHEVLEINDEIKKLIFKGASEDEIEQKAIENGMITLQEDGFIKAAMGITSIEEILRTTKE
ncbi:MAG: GspE/PulE family protein [Patescibacteria group bacterium]|nr:GspE/PulE family protein [Patescibacteria group bacterium]